MQRHDMLYLDRPGMETALTSALSRNPHLSPDDLTTLFAADIPAIVCRQENPEVGLLQVGFSGWWFTDGSRTRAGAIIPVGSITQIVTPFQAMERLPSGDRRAEALVDLREAGLREGIAVGVYGSFALELLTGRPYTTPNSDLDVYIRPRSQRPGVRRFLDEASRIGRECGVVFDIEAECAVGGVRYGVKLKELLSGQKTVLAKGFSSVELFARSESLFTMEGPVE